MWRILQLLIYGHVHRWHIIQTDLVKRPGGKDKIVRKYTMQCKMCGNIKTKVAK